MTIEDIRLNLTHKEGATKAFGSISLDGQFAVRGLRVMEDKNGRNFVSMPSRQKGDGTYEDVCFPLNKEFYHEIQDAVITRYNEINELEQQKGEEETQDAKQAEKAAETEAKNHAKKGKGR